MAELGSNAVSVIIPAHNEARALPATLRGVREQSPDAEVIVVDDGSTDGTGDLAAEAGVRVVRHTHRSGNGAAVKSGARVALGRVLVFLDADGQHDPRDIPRLLARLAEGADMVVGARSKRSQASLPRRVANGFYNWLASYMTEQPVQDLTSGFRAVRAERFCEFLYLLPNTFSYPTTITMAFFRAGYGVEYIPIEAARRPGKSHIRPLADGIRFLLIIFKVGTLYSPLKLFFPVALGYAVLGLGYYAYTYATEERLSIATVFFLTTAVLVFLIGLVAEQITQLMYRPTCGDSGKGARDGG